MDISGGSSYSYEEKLNAFREEAQMPGMDRSSRNQLSERAASIVASIQDGAKRQEAIETLNEILIRVYAPCLDLSGAVQRTVGKISSQTKKLEGPHKERAETPPSTFFEDRLEDFRKASRFKNNKLMNEIVEQFEPGSKERLQLETMRTLAEEEQINFELKALLHDQVGKNSELEQAKIVEKAQRVLDRAPNDLQDEVFKRLFILFRPLHFANKIQHPKGEQYEKELLVGSVTLSSWQKEAEAIKTKYEHFEKNRSKWSLNELVKLVNEFEKLEEDWATLDVNWREHHQLIDARDSLLKMGKKLWEAINSRGSLIDKEIDLKCREHIRSKGEFPLPETLFGFDSLESWWTIEAVPILEKSTLFFKDKADGQEWTPDQLAEFIQELGRMRSHKNAFAAIDEAAVSRLFDEAVTNKMQETDKAVAEKLGEIYQEQFHKKMDFRVLRTIRNEGKFPST